MGLIEHLVYNNTIFRFYTVSVNSKQLKKILETWKMLIGKEVVLK